MLGPLKKVMAKSESREYISLKVDRKENYLWAWYISCNWKKVVTQYSYSPQMRRCEGWILRSEVACGFFFLVHSQECSCYLNEPNMVTVYRPYVYFFTASGIHSLKRSPESNSNFYPSGCLKSFLISLLILCLSYGLFRIDLFSSQIF